MNVTFRQIEYVMAIYETGSLSAAARKLFISQPALSQNLKKLESDLGIVLFQRENQPLKATLGGEIFIREGKELLAQRSMMLVRLRAHASTRNETVRLGISPFYSKYYLPIIYPYITQHFPLVHLDVTEAISVHLEQLTLDGEIDLCFVPVEPKNPKLHYETVCMEEILLAVPPDTGLERYATPSPGVPYIDLKYTGGENFIILKSEQKFSLMNENLFSMIHPKPNIVYETLNWDTVHILVSSGLGMGFIPEVLYGTLSSENRPSYFRISNAKTVRAYAAAYRKNTVLSPVAQSLVEIFRTNVHAFQNKYRIGINTDG